MTITNIRAHSPEESSRDPHAKLINDIAEDDTKRNNNTTIAVLPFSNISDNSTQDYIGEALAADIISGLSRVKSFFVIARNSTQQFKGKANDVRYVSKELNVRYILEGTIQISGDRLRLSVELIDGLSGHHLWTEKFDRRMQDIFDVQDELTRQVVARLEPEIVRAEVAVTRLKQPETLSAWEAYHKGLLIFSRKTANELSQAKELFNQVLNIDPTFSPALAALSQIHFENTLFGYDSSSSYQEALVLAKRGADLDPNNSLCHVALSFAYVGLRNLEKALEEAMAAVELNQNSVDGHLVLANCLIHMGKPREAIPHLKLSIALSPRQPKLHVNYTRLAHAYLYNSEFEEAVTFSRLAIDGGNSAWISRAVLCSALGHLVETDKVQKVIDDWKSITTDVNVEFVKTHIPTVHKPSMDILLDGLRKANLPEVAPTGS